MPAYRAASRVSRCAVISSSIMGSTQVARSKNPTTPAFWRSPDHASHTFGHHLWLLFSGVFRQADLLLKVAPHTFRPAVGSGDPGCGASVDPAVQRLVPLPQLLPFESAEAAFS